MNETDEFCSRLIDQNWELRRVNTLLLEAIPDPEKLELLASWIDHKYPDDSNPEIQRDLRKWAAAGHIAITAVNEGV